MRKRSDLVLVTAGLALVAGAVLAAWQARWHQLALNGGPALAAGLLLLAMSRRGR